VKTYFDSSAFAKRYIEEAGSARVDSQCQNATELALSVLTVPEIISALNRRVRERSLEASQYAHIKRLLSEEIRDVTIVDLTEAVVLTCIQVLETSPLRAADALHVACAIEWKAELFLTADKKQADAAEKAGLWAELV